jgi:hypothetical protein
MNFPPLRNFQFLKLALDYETSRGYSIKFNFALFHFNKCYHHRFEWKIIIWKQKSSVRSFRVLRYNWFIKEIFSTCRSKKKMGNDINWDFRRWFFDAGKWRRESGTWKVSVEHHPQFSNISFQFPPPKKSKERNFHLSTRVRISNVKDYLFSHSLRFIVT